MTIKRINIKAIYKSFLVLVVLASTTWGQLSESLTNQIKANSYPLTVSNGNLSGSGMDLLIKASSDAQFFVIGEEHNVKEVPEITSMLFSALHNRYGYNYLALEQDPLSCLLASRQPFLGNAQTLFDYSKKYPQSFTFNTDEELRMIAETGRTSSAKTDRIWGLDQMFGGLHVLERLIEYAPNKDARERTLKLIEHARKYDSTRFKEGIDQYMLGGVQKPDDFYKLGEIYQPKKGSEAEFLINQLLISARIYQHYYDGTKEKIPGYFENGREREENMKDLFMMHYRNAQAKGDKMPKVLMKLGYWHTIRGIYKANVPTLGNFVSDFARINGMKSFHLAVFINNPPGGFRALPETSAFTALAESAPLDSWTIIDFRPLRDYAQAGKFKGIKYELYQAIFAFDAAIIIGGGRQGSHEFTPQ